MDRMELKEEQLHPKFDKRMNLGTNSIHFKGSFLFCHPYSWEESVNWEIIKKLTKTVTDWTQMQIPADEGLSEAVQCSVILGFYNCPSSWRQKSPTDPRTYAKVALLLKMVHFVVMMDDTTEGEVGKSTHSIYVLTVGNLVTQILQQDFESMEVLTSNELYHIVTQTSLQAAAYMRLLKDLAKDLKTNFGVTKELGKYFSRLTGYMFAMQSWCGCEDHSHLLNPYTQHHQRIFTGGARCVELAGFLPLRVNDIIGLEREWVEMRQFGKRVDNVVFHYMDASNCSFEQALTGGVNEHNLALKEFHDILEFSKSNLEFLYDLDAVFATSTFILGECVACSIQGQALMRRYSAGLEFTFEKD
ncbi:unnamed protein product [Allacma fusca]|uniref:Uncharacterized protein n=1 Tax=Allacma fusca TaxID=39272 RepID=A0A8J2PNF3_9HEXA|nr:unnamed protein product [Allacma fusca]